MTSTLRAGLLVALALLATGCPKAQTRHYYTLTFPPSQPRFEARFPYSIRVKDFGINATYQGDQLVFRQDVHEVEYAKERRWTERPPRMVADLVRKYLRQSGLVDQVQGKLGEKPPDFQLEGDIDAIEELESGEDSYAHLSMSLRLVRFDSGAVVWRHSFDERRKVPGAKSRAIVRALSEILELELSKSVDELGRYFAGFQSPKEPPQQELQPGTADGVAPSTGNAPEKQAPGPGSEVGGGAGGGGAAKPEHASALLRPDPSSPLLSHPQLASDETPMPAGKGALFFPALSDAPAREPSLGVFRDEELVASGRMGTRVVVDPGTYDVRFGSGAGRQQFSMTVVVEEGRVTAAEPRWSSLEVRVVNERFIGYRGSYELISIPAREEYGIGFGVDEEQGEEVKVWVLPPGLYKIVQAGGTYRDRVNFATVYLEPGKLTRFNLVRDQDTGDFKGAGVMADEEAVAGVAGPWKRSLVVGGDVKVGYSDDIATKGWNFDVSLFVDAMVRYWSEPHVFVSRVELEEGLLRPASTRRFEPYFDRLYFHNIYTFHLLPWVGPYVRAGLETKILPRYKSWDSPQERIEEYDEDGALVRTYTDVDRVQLGNPFAPFQLKEGIGGNFRALHTHWADLDLRVGVGARQYFPLGELAVERTADAERLVRVSAYNLEGVEGAIVGTARISRWVTLTTEFDGLMPFSDAELSVFTWRTQASLRLVSFASLNYLLNVTRDPNRRAGAVMSWEQLFQLRFSYNIF